MATRDLTRKFVELREFKHAAKKRAAPNAEYDKFSDNGLLEDAGAATSWANTRHELPPVWVDKVDVVEDDVRKIQLKMRDLSALHTKRLMVTFDETEHEKEREIEMITAEITKLFRHAEQALKKVMSEGDPSKLTPAEMTVRNNIQRATARKLQSLSMAFRNGQKDYLRRLKAQKQGDGDFDFLSEEEKSSKYGAGGIGGGEAPMVDRGFNQQQMQVLENTEALVAERDKEIQAIVKSIEELSTIFKELAVLVIDQGTILDRIDFNMEQVVEHTKEGIVQLQKAEEHQKSALPAKCIAILLFLIALMVAVLIVKHTRRK